MNNAASHEVVQHNCKQSCQKDSKSTSRSIKQVVKSNNTDSNKRDKIREIYEEKNIKTLDTSTKLYEFFEKKYFKEKMIRMFISRPELLNQLEG